MARKRDEDKSRQAIERALDRELEDTFPASDPLKITRGLPDAQATTPVAAKDQAKDKSPR